MMKLVKIFLWLLVIPFSSLFAQDIDFYREDISFELVDGYFKVNGKYYFRNPTEDIINSGLIYPFPIDSCYGAVDSVLAFDMIRNKDNLKQTTNKAAVIGLYLEPFDTTVINISYRQELKNNKAEYILTTTQSWGKEFEVANYELMCDSCLEIEFISYYPDTILTLNNKHIYYWSREKFMPDKDFTIFFRKKGE